MLQNCSFPKCSDRVKIALDSATTRRMTGVYDDNRYATCLFYQGSAFNQRSFRVAARQDTDASHGINVLMLVCLSMRHVL